MEIRPSASRGALLAQSGASEIPVGVLEHGEVQPRGRSASRSPSWERRDLQHRHVMCVCVCRRQMDIMFRGMCLDDRTCICEERARLQSALDPSFVRGFGS